MSKLKPFLPSAGCHGLGPWVELAHQGEKRSAIVTDRTVTIDDAQGCMIEEYTVRITTVTDEALMRGGS